jgi:cysteine synthase
MDILDAVGNTSMVRLRRVVPANGASVFAKLEWENPTEAFSQEKRDHMAALGAELTLVPSEAGLTTKKLILEMIVLAVATGDAKDMARRLAREEALFAGMASGANVVAALRVAEQLGPAARVVTLMCDSGLKYLSTDVYGTR